MAVRVTVEARGESAAVVTMSGRLDAAATGDFEAALLPLAENPAVVRIVLEGAGLEYVASAGLRVLLKAVKAMIPKKGKLYGVGLGPPVVSVLKVTGFLAYIELRPTVDACLE